MSDEKLVVVLRQLIREELGRGIYEAFKHVDFGNRMTNAVARYVQPPCPTTSPRPHAKS